MIKCKHCGYEKAYDRCACGRCGKVNYKENEDEREIGRDNKKP